MFIFPIIYLNELTNILYADMPEWQDLVKMLRAQTHTEDWLPTTGKVPGVQEIFKAHNPDPWHDGKFIEFADILATVQEWRKSMTNLQGVAVFRQLQVITLLDRQESKNFRDNREYNIQQFGERGHIFVDAGLIEKVVDKAKLSGSDLVKAMHEVIGVDDGYACFDMVGFLIGCLYIMESIGYGSEDLDVPGDSITTWTASMLERVFGKWGNVTWKKHPKFDEIGLAWQAYIEESGEFWLTGIDLGGVQGFLQDSGES